MTALDTIVAKFRKQSPNIGAAFDEVQRRLTVLEKPPPVVTTPPVPLWPSSFTTGPLGANVPLPKSGRFLIEYAGIPGGTWAATQQMIVQRETAIGRSFDGVHTQLWWAKGSLQPAERGENRLEWIAGRNQIPCVSANVQYSIVETNQGAADATWAAVADYLQSLGFPVMLRLWWEFDNTAGFPWAVGQSANIGGPFVAAWKRVVNIFQARGATNVGFWWCPLEGGDRAGVIQSYPGDGYVDWVGSDIYNGCYHGETSCWNTPLHSGWATFAEACLYGQTSQYALWSPRKPFVVGELACVHDPNGPAAAKGDWYRAIPAALKTAPNLIGLSFFDQNITAYEGPKANWLVGHPVSNPDVMAGFAQMAKGMV